MTGIDRLLARARGGGEVGDAALAELAALIEQKVRGWSDGHDPERPPTPLSDAELERVILSLLEILATADPPSGAAVWALGEARDRRVMEPSRQIVERYRDGTGTAETHLLYNAVGVLYAFAALETVKAETWQRLAERQDDLGELVRDLREHLPGP